MRLALWPFRERNPFLLWVGRLSVFYADVVQDVVLIWVTWEVTGSSTATAAVTFMSRSPIWIFGLLGGVVADRHQVRRTLLISNFLAATVALLVPLLGFLGLVNVYVLGVAAFCISTARVFEAPALYTQIRSLVPPEKIQGMNGITDTTKRIARLLGPLIASYLRYVIGTINLYFTISLGFLVMGATVLFFREAVPGRIPDGSARSFGSDLKSVLQVLGSRRLLRIIILMDAVFSVAYAGCYWVFLPRLSIDLLGGGPQAYGVMVASVGAGGLVAGSIGALLPFRNKLLVMAAGFATAGGAFAAMGVAGSVASLAALAAAVGAAMSLQNIALLSLMHEVCPSEHLGRVYSVWRLVVETASGAALLCAGVAADTLGADVAIVGVGGLAVVMMGGLYAAAVASAGPLPQEQDSGSG